LNKAHENELKTKSGNISKVFFFVRDFVRIIQHSDKTRQVWSNDIYVVEKVNKPEKSYSVYVYKLKDLKDKFEGANIIKSWDTTK
jgi:hypothetical protein